MSELKAVVSEPQMNQESAKVTSAAVIHPVIKPIKLRCEEIRPSSIIDVWRLYENSLKLAPPVYPSMDQEAPEVIRAQLFQMLAAPHFVGGLVRHGKKPVGQITALVSNRMFGAPRIYLQVGIFWVEPDYRKQGVGELLVKELFRRAKTMGIHHFESWSDLGLSEAFLKFLKGKGAVVSHRISGKITLE